MIRRFFCSSCLVVSLCLVAGVLCASSSAFASRRPRPVEVILADTGKTVAVPMGQELVVTLPLLHYEDDYWYLAENTGGGLTLIAQPVQKRARNWTPWGYSRQEFHFRREAAGTSHLVLERAYWSHPMVLKVIDAPALPPSAYRSQPPPPPVVQQVRERVILRGIHFDFDKSNIRPGDAAVLDEDVAKLKSSPNVTVDVNGYCDATGSPEYNLKLSQRRADAVLDYLSNQGIRESRLIPHGYGKTNFVATNATKEGRAENRRVELLPNDQPGQN